MLLWIIFIRKTWCWSHPIKQQRCNTLHQGFDEICSCHYAKQGITWMCIQFFLMISNLTYKLLPGFARIRTKSILGLWAATRSARAAPKDSPTRYIGLSTDWSCSFLTVFWTSITSSAPSTSLDENTDKVSTEREREEPGSGVRSAAGMCKHQISKILHTCKECIGRVGKVWGRRKVVVLMKMVSDDDLRPCTYICIWIYQCTYIHICA